MFNPNTRLAYLSIPAITRSFSNKTKKQFGNTNLCTGVTAILLFSTAGFNHVNYLDARRSTFNSITHDNQSTATAIKIQQVLYVVDGADL